LFELWTKNWRRRRIVKRQIPFEWPNHLTGGLWHWQVLNPEQRIRLLKLIAIFLHEKEFVVPAQIHEVESVRVVVAGAACLMLLGFDDWYCFDRVETVVLSLDPIVERMQISGSTGVVGDVVATGIYSKGSPIRLVWPEVQRQCRQARSLENVLIHEFAHHIDDLDGTLAGDPPFQSRRLELRWEQVAKQEIKRLEADVANGQETILDPYGLENSVEFFAVACEAFFCQPVELRRFHRELFELLSTLFRLDPRPWFRA
jgi:Mlc titration factor MtfA (ptsG expression regulator)